MGTDEPACYAGQLVSDPVAVAEGVLADPRVDHAADAVGNGLMACVLV